VSNTETENAQQEVEAVSVPKQITAAQLAGLLTLLLTLLGGVGTYLKITSQLNADREKYEEKLISDNERETNIDNTLESLKTKVALLVAESETEKALAVQENETAIKTDNRIQSLEAKQRDSSDHQAIVDLLAFMREQMPAYIAKTETRLGDLESTHEIVSEMAVEFRSVSTASIELKAEANELRVQIESDKARINEFQLVKFPEIVKNIEQQLADLADLAGDAAGDLQRLTEVVEENTEERKGQRLRAATRIAEHGHRDVRINNAITQIETLQKWRNSMAVGRLEVLNAMLQNIEIEIQKLKAAIPYGSSSEMNFTPLSDEIAPNVAKIVW